MNARKRHAISPGRRGLRRQHRGFSLVELLIAVVLGLFVVAVVVQGFAATTSSSNTNSAVAESRTNGRHALEVLKREVRHAALAGMVWESTQIVNEDANLVNKNYGCGAGFVNQLGVGISGGNDSNPFYGICLQSESITPSTAATTASYARGDVLVLRRTAMQAATSFDAGAPYVRIAYGVANLSNGSSTPPLLAAPNFDYRVVSDIFYVNAFTSSGTEAPRVPALYRLTLSAGANPVMTPQLVASNVEHFQVQFAEDDGLGNVRYRNANAVTDWSLVRSARFWLLLRESLPDPGFASGSYVMGDVTYTPADNYRRAVYTTTVALRN